MSLETLLKSLDEIDAKYDDIKDGASIAANTEKKEIEAKIIRKLKYYNLGKFDLEKVEYLRTIKNDLFSEISNCLHISA